MLTETLNIEKFSIRETPKALPRIFFVLGVISLLMGAIGDRLNFSPPRFDAYELLCIVVGVVFIFTAISLATARAKFLKIPYLPEKVFNQVNLAVTLFGLCISAMSGFTLANQTNSADMFNDLVRTPPVESMRFANMIIPFFAGFVIIYIGTQLDKHGRKIVPAILMSIITRWRAISSRVRVILFLEIVVLLGAANYAVVMHAPFSYQGGWDDWTGAYRRLTIVTSNDGLAKGCNLCTGDLKPLESVTDGDDIGLSFAFGEVVKLGLFKPDLASYQQFIGLLVAGAVVFSTLFVTVGYGSMFAGLVFGIFMSLFSSVPLYQVLLETIYWVPGGAAIVTSGLVLAIIARAERNQRTDRREVLLYVVGFAIWGFVGSLSYLGRSNAGVSMLLPAVILLAYFVVRYRWYARTAVLVIVLVISFAIPIAAFNYTLSWRFGTYNPPDPAQTTHSFSHALYVGLGYVTNKEDIRWLDTVGFEHAKAQCSADIVILSADYYNCVRNLFIKTVVSDPNLLIRNLLAKSESILQTSMTHLSFFWLLPLLVLFFRRKFIYLVLAFTLVMFLLPGILVFPYFSYMIGYGEILIAALVVGLISFFERLVFALTTPAKDENVSAA